LKILLKLETCVVCIHCEQEFFKQNVSVLPDLVARRINKVELYVEPGCYWDWFTIPVIVVSLLAWPSLRGQVH